MSHPQPATPLRLYGAPVSGHVHRVRLFLSILGLPFEEEALDLRAGEHKTPDFLALNAFGQVPVLRDGDTVVADSNAILVYLNARYAADPARWLPADPFGAAQVQRWLSVAAGPLAFGPAAARVVALFGLPTDPAELVARSQRLLAVMDAHLAQQPFLAAGHATLADLANYAYVARAPEGGVSLEPHAALRDWLVRVEALPGFVPMPVTAAARPA